jgi:hypothetical protein
LLGLLGVDADELVALVLLREVNTLPSGSCAL